MPLFAFFLMFFAAKAENKVLWEYLDTTNAMYGTMYCCKFSPDEKYIIHTVGDTSQVVVRDVETGVELRRSESLGYTPMNMYFSEDGSKIILASGIRITILGIDSLNVIANFTINDEYIFTAGFTTSIVTASYYDNDKSIIVALHIPSYDNPMMIFLQIDPNNTKDQKVIGTYYGIGNSTVQSPDRKMIAFSMLSFNDDISLEVFDVLNQKKYFSSGIGVGKNHGWTPPTVNWSNDSKYCVTTGDNAIIFDIANKSEYYRFSQEDQSRFGFNKNRGNLFLPKYSKLIDHSRSLKAIDIPALSYKSLVDLTEPDEFAWGKIVSNKNESLIIGCGVRRFRIYQISDISAVDDHSESDEFTIYPNPSSDFCYIDLNGNTMHNILLTSNTGEDMTASIHYQMLSDSKLEINTSVLPKGMYFISIVINNNTALKYKLIKE